MTVIVWDGNILAADRRANVEGSCSAVTKIYRLESGEVAAFSGSLGTGMILVEWYKNGAKKDEWPNVQSTDDWARLVVASKEGLFFYESHPVQIRFLDKYTAFGSGRDIALGALAMGANAIKAVEIVSQFQVECGNGCDWFDVDSLSI